MRSTRMLLLGLVVVVGVLFAAGEVMAQNVCFAWNRLACSFDFSLVQGTTNEAVSNSPSQETCDDIVPQLYWLDIIAVATPGGPFFKFIGRHDGACGVGTSRPMEGTAWVRSNGRIDLGFVTYGNTSTSGSKSSDEFDTNCGDIKSRAVVDFNQLSGTIKWTEHVSRSTGGTRGRLHVEQDESFGPFVPGQPFNSVICPASTPGN